MGPSLPFAGSSLAPQAGTGAADVTSVQDDAALERMEARRMLGRIKAAPMIEGVRGEKGLDKNFLIESMLRLSQLMVDIPELREIDLNPVIVFENGGVAVDAKIILG